LLIHTSGLSQVKAVVIGLGAGLLPMFLHRCIPVLEIEVIYIFPVIDSLSRSNSKLFVFRMILYDITCLDVNLFLQAVELDPVIVDIARKHFSFVEDKRLKVLNLRYL
jgi:hypothetical protein